MLPTLSLRPKIKMTVLGYSNSVPLREMLKVQVHKPTAGCCFKSCMSPSTLGNLKTQSY